MARANNPNKNWGKRKLTSLLQKVYLFNGNHKSIGDLDQNLFLKSAANLNSIYLLFPKLTVICLQ